jgi:hypothetical protein
MTKAGLLAAITAHYLDSRDFNGLAVGRIGSSPTEVEPVLRRLVAEGLVSIPVFGADPHIKAFPAEPIDVQLDALGRFTDFTHVVAYPEPKHLEEVVDRSTYEGRPYTLRMALGAGQLEPVYFELSILEQYRNDPRYYYETNETSGSISVTDEHYSSAGMRESDKVLLQSFGFGHDEAMHRAVCVFSRYLIRLTAEHQQIWRARELDDRYRMHPAYYTSSILGEFPDGISMFEAFIEELGLLKRMSAAIARPALVRESFEDRKPANFTFLIRPTLKELQDFHATLDKMMSENLNKKFLVACLGDSAHAAADKGTIQVLGDWLDRARLADRAPVDAMLATFREVRKLRQRPAHTTDDNVFDLTYYEQQRELMERAYRAILTLRLVITSHPALTDFEVPAWHEERKVYVY